jgi:hypothetical protein
LEDLELKARLAASIVLTLGLAVGVSGCTLITPQDTVGMKKSSAGVDGKVGQIDIQDAVIISNNGTLGNVVTTFVNNGDSAQTVQVQQGSTTASVKVSAGGVTRIGGQGDHRVQLKNLNAQPGSLTDVYFSYAGQTGVKIQVPVLESSYPGFSGYAPKKSTPKQTGTPTPSATAMAGTTATPTPTP